MERPVVPPAADDLPGRTVDVIRGLAMDAVEKAGNGHPGTAMSLAPAAYTLFQDLLRHDPVDPSWPGRDRFVLSVGHSSLTLYIQLFLSGTGLSIEDLKSLRQWGSLTPGHPEHGHTPGVETTTGPLGQGIATAVGMAAAARKERGLFDPDAPVGQSPFDHTIWVFASDGDLEEGISSEACSWAGHQRLGNLVVLYDDNHISIEGNTDVAFSEDVLKRYEAYGWHTHRVSDSEDRAAIEKALAEARDVTDRPSIVAMTSVIAWPAPDARNTGAAHGSALGADEIAATKKLMGMDPSKTFDVPEDVLQHTRGGRQSRGKELHDAWQEAFAAWREREPERAELYDRLHAGRLPDGWANALPTWEEGDSVATRSASGAVLSALKDVLPELWGGSADLAGSTDTTMKGADSFLPLESGAPDANPYGRTLHFGIREHAMGAICNGIALHGPTRPYGATFFVFSDYMRGAVRIGALQKAPAVWVWTHDSIGLGEDGPTHQPIEHLASLRAMPNLAVVRPADATETAGAWKHILEHRDGPVGLVLTRQKVPVLSGTSAEGVARGGYVVADASAGLPQVILIATGSEVQIAVAAREKLEAEGTPTRVVSLPCWEWFDQQDVAYQATVLPPEVRARVSVEAASVFGWSKHVGDRGASVGIDHFGASAPYTTLYEQFGITADRVVAAAHESLVYARGEVGSTTGN
ncbi:MAG TPA: transketolase [Mycobacteriales bacterium]|nr:transketolase [Mycobacteriales bacterium]